MLPFCADFEEGPLAFVKRLPSSNAVETESSIRCVVVLGNTFGNIRDEESFMRQKIAAVVRPGDFLWLEIALLLDPAGQRSALRDDPAEARRDRR